MSDCFEGVAYARALLAQNQGFHETRAVSEHRSHSARARCERRAGLLQIDYSGSISQATAIALCRRVLPERRGVMACLERIDSALTMLDYPPILNTKSFPAWIPPITIIVRADQMAHSLAVNLLLARGGVIRMSWLPDQIEQARGWVAQMGALHPAQQRCT